MCAHFQKTFIRNSRQVFCKKGVLRNFGKYTEKHLWQSLFNDIVTGPRAQASNFIRKETLAQVFSCEFCNVFYKTPPMVASVSFNEKIKFLLISFCQSLILSDRLDINLLYLCCQYLQFHYLLKKLKVKHGRFVIKLRLLSL